MNRIILFLTAAFFLSPTAWAVNFVVTNSADSGPGTLRDAVKQANSTPGKDIITFHAGPILSDSVSSINIMDPVIIEGESNYTISAVNTTVGGGWHCEKIRMEVKYGI